jgi:hypothetical protein
MGKKYNSKSKWQNSEMVNAGKNIINDSIY